MIARASRLLVPLALALSCIAAPVRGHFLWVQLTGEPTARQINLWFAEIPELTTERLVDKMGAAEVTLVTTEERAPLTVTKSVQDDAGGLVAPLPAIDGDFAVEAAWQYGVFDREGEPFLLQYYAKHAGTPRTWGLAAAGTLLDVTAARQGPNLQLKVTWKGEPLADAPVVIETPAGDTIEAKSDSTGHVLVEKAAPGAYAVRAEHVVADQAGKLGDKDYTHARYYASLTFENPPLDAANAGEEVSATELLARARAARAVWNNFPGMTAKLRIVADGLAEDARVTLHSDGRYELEGSDSLGSGWAKTQLRTLVQHRMPDNSLGEEAEYADQDKSHPLGRLIILQGSDLESAYRIDGDVVAEVNRTMGKTKFTISVLSVSRNAEGHYLPESFTVSYWDKDSGEIRSVESMYNSWTRIGGFDLPQKVIGILSKDGVRNVFEIDFSDHQLLDEAAAAAQPAAAAAGR